MAEHPAGHLVLKWLIEQDITLTEAGKEGNTLALAHTNSPTDLFTGNILCVSLPSYYISLFIFVYYSSPHCDAQPTDSEDTPAEGN